MKDQKKAKSKIAMGGVAGCLVVLVVVGMAYALKFLFKEDSHRRRRQIQMVTVVKPPPPPKVEEKPPEPEIKKKEEFIEPEAEDTPPDEPMEDEPMDDTPPGEDLALDADGTAGSDAFGLKGKRGGRALIGGGRGNASMMRRYAWYTRIIQDELRKRMNRHMEENGGIPDGDLKVLVQITLDDFGKVIDFKLARSSGNQRMDDAVVDALNLAEINEPPPNGMPRMIKLRISAKG